MFCKTFKFISVPKCLTSERSNFKPTEIAFFSISKTLTTEIAAQMGNVMEGGEMKAALWTMALLLFLISLLFITVIHKFSKPKGE